MYWDFSNILRTASDAPFGADDGPLIVEIGFGNGEFLAHLAQHNRDRLVVGIEVSSWCLTKAARRALAAGAENIRLMHGDARALLKWAFRPGSIEALYMNFPCPWPKRRHADRRVTSELFCGRLQASLMLGGSFKLATDVDWYANDTRNAFSACEGFAAGEVLLNPEREYITKYERKWLQMGRDTYTVEVKKIREGSDMTDYTEGEDCALEGQGGDGLKVLSELCGTELVGKDFRVVFRETYYDGYDSALLSVICLDEGFEQRYYLRVTKTERGLFGKPDSVGFPYRTPAVRASIRHVLERAGVRF